MMECLKLLINIIKRLKLNKSINININNHNNLVKNEIENKDEKLKILIKDE